MRGIAVLAISVLLAACSTEEDKPGGVSQDEARALDAAADMLDERELPALPEATMPAQDAPSPSAS